MVYCYVCGQEINFLAWSNHVIMEKKRHGDNIYQILKAEREKRLKKVKELKKNPHNKRLEEFE